MPLERKDLLDMDSLTAPEIGEILDTAASFKQVSERQVKKVPALRGQTVVTLFFEPSTRTRTSFELAAKRLSADVLNFNVSVSSASKGESLLDTVQNIQAMNVDILVVRHGASGAPHLIARHLPSHVVNAGDGGHAHPTQALLDMFTIREKKGRLAGLRVAIVGDIAHSRVARSNFIGMHKMGVEVVACGPRTLLPPHLETLGVRVTDQIDEAVEGADVVMMLRLQKERQGSHLLPSLREYSRFFGLTDKRLARAKSDAIVMHPGPMNRGLEIQSEVADGPSSVILEQVTNGVAVRMAVLYLLSGGAKENVAD